MKKFFCLLVFLLSVTSSYGLLNDLIILKNHTRPGYDDNIFTRTSGNETGSYYVEQIVSIDAILAADQRYMLSTMYSPKFVWRDIDKKQMLYHTWVSKLQYKLPNQKSTIDTSHKWTVSEREPTDIDIDADITWEQTQTDFQFSHTYSRKHSSVFKLQNKTKRWSENLLAVGEMYTDGDFDQYTLSAQQILEVWYGKLFWTYGVEGTYHDYANSRGGYRNVQLYNNIVYVLNPKAVLLLDTWYGNHITVLQEDDRIQLSTENYLPSWKVAVNSQWSKNLMTGLNISYETIDSSIAFWNAKDVYKIMANVKYNITPKLETMSAIVVSKSNYLEDYDRNGTGLTREDYLGVVIWNNTYNIDKNHALELNFMGFAMNPHKDLESVARNKLTFGYRLTL